MAVLDPWTIRLPGGELDGSSTPKLDWVGLLAVFRACGVTDSYLDPRLAAPEHFEPARGGIDQATDIYGLGAIVYGLPPAGRRSRARLTKPSGPSSRLLRSRPATSGPDYRRELTT
ncbi:MAG: hypothetical protein V5A34_02060 [Halapricum sp.]